MNLPTVSRFSSIVLLTFFLAAAGCRTAPKSPPPIESNSTQLAATSPAGLTLSAAELEPLDAVDRIFAVTRGPRTGRDLSAKVEPDGSHRWKYTLEATRVVWVERNPGGGMSVPREQDSAEGVDIAYKPALVLLPPSLTINEPFTQTCEMIVTNLKDGAPRDRGTCTITVKLVGQRKVMTPAGEFECAIVESTRVIDLHLAKVDVAVRTAYAPKLGTVAEGLAQTTRALGIIGSTTEEEIRLKRP